MQTLGYGVLVEGLSTEGRSPDLVAVFHFLVSFPLPVCSGNVIFPLPHLDGLLTLLELEANVKLPHFWPWYLITNTHTKRN